MPFPLAAALTDRKVGLSQGTDAKAKNILILNLEQKIKMRPFPDVIINEKGNNCPDVVTIKMKSENKFSHSVLQANGHSERPLCWNEVLGKFCDCARLAMTEKQVEKSIELMVNLESLSNIRENMGILAG